MLDLLTHMILIHENKKEEEDPKYGRMNAFMHSYLFHHHHHRIQWQCVHV